MPSNTTTDNPAKILDAKVKAKVAIQKELGWPTEAKKPMLCIPTGLTEELGGPLFTKLIDGLVSLGIQVLILGKGSASYGEMVSKLSSEKKHLFAIIPNDESSQKQMYLAADMALFLSNPKGMKEVQTCLSNGVVPISPKNDELEKYNAIQESGNAFIFDKLNEWSCYAAVVRAVETHVFPFDWKTIQKHCMES
ncbi:MAG: hypothetical protein O2904_01215 [bacterium]|nr:hypothetical protein [bacterium]